MAAAASYILLLGAGTIWPGTVSTGWTSTTKIQGAEVSAVRWRASLPEAISEASSQRKPLLIDFYADWCIACKELDLYTYTDADVGKAMEGLVAVKLDGTDSEDPRFQEPYQKYGVLGLPTVLFLTPDGQVLSNLTLTGFEPPKEFLKRIAAAKAASPAGQ